MKNKFKIYPFIMSGGAGKRLWPLSRSLYPKQFVQLNNNLSYFQETLLRLDKNTFHPPSVICNLEHRFMVKEQAKSINKKISNIYLEPIGRNTTAAAIISALACNESDLILLLPSDHVISNRKKFNESIKKSIEQANLGKIILFGVKPTKPESGYGYMSVKNSKIPYHFEVKDFIEKPHEALVKKLSRSKSTFWNSGIFLFKASKLLKESRKYCLNNLKNTSEAFKKRKYDGDYYLLDKTYFSKNKDISIDYSIMQNSKSLLMSKLSSDWSDMGTWERTWSYNKKGVNKNFIVGKNFSENCKNSLIVSDKQFTVTIGLENMIVASFSDSLLVMKKEDSNSLSNVIKKIEKNSTEELKNSSKCYRPWGSYESLKIGDGFQVKEIIIRPNSSISLQKHKKRFEHWAVIEGIATVTKGKKKYRLTKNQSIDIKIGEIHRLENKTDNILRIIEIQTGSYVGEDDIERFEDEYKRI